MTSTTTSLTAGRLPAAAPGFARLWAAWRSPFAPRPERAARAAAAELVERARRYRPTQPGYAEELLALAAQIDPESPSALD